MFERFCPMCETPSEKFEKYGVSNRDDAQCLNCGSIERYRLLSLYLRKETDFFTREKNVFVDIGPRNELSKMLDRYKNITHLSFDINPSIAKIKADIKNIPMPSNCADYLLCYHVLEHVNDDKTALSEIHRILKPSGIAFIQVPIDTDRSQTFQVPTSSSDERLRWYGQKDHVRIYGNDFENLLNSTGFDVKRINYTSSFSDTERKLFGLKDVYKLLLYHTSEDIFVVKKK